MLLDIYQSLHLNIKLNETEVQWLINQADKVQQYEEALKEVSEACPKLDSVENLIAIAEKALDTY